MKFYPGTGDFDRIGFGEGKNFAINVPLAPGCNDDTFRFLFKKTFESLIKVYPADVIFL